MSWVPVVFVLGWVVGACLGIVIDTTRRLQSYDNKLLEEANAHPKREVIELQEADYEFK